LNTALIIFGINSRRIAGSEIYARELSRQLDEHGWRSVICFHNAVPELVRSYLSLPNVSLDVVPEPWGVSWRTSREMLRVFRTYKPRVVNLQYTGFMSPYAWLARLCSVEKVFFTDQTSPPEGHVPKRAPVWKRCLGRIINHPMTGVICASDYGYLCNSTRDLLPQDRYHRVYNAVMIRDDDGVSRAQHFRRKYGIPEDRLLIAQLSWMIPEKGIFDLLEAARQVVALNPRAHFALVGDGDYLEQFMQRATALGIENHVTWTGNIGDPYAEGVQAAADVLCQMSRWEEVFGFVIAEGMAARKPVVATRVGGIPELVEDGRTGFLVERGDSKAMADKLLLLLDDAGLRKDMGERGRLAAESLFDVRKNVAQVLQLYGISAAAERASVRPTPVPAAQTL
jgi:glycosyltransferase involved in cell wall biosynthesis